MLPRPRPVFLPPAARGAGFFAESEVGTLSLLDELDREEVWQLFLEYKLDHHCSACTARELREFIEARAYEPVCAAIRAGEPFPLPRRAVISKMSTGKKRVVYVYPRREATVLKLLTFLVLRKYDRLFDPNLYSFRPGISAKDAIRALTARRDISELWCCKLDIHDYFNSVDLDRFLPLLEEALADDPPLYAFFSALLREPCVLDGGQPRPEAKGIMAGTPQSAFFADLYLRELDHSFLCAGIPYARYSDDMIFFSRTEDERAARLAEVRTLLDRYSLTVNPEKEAHAAPGEAWVFLGFSFQKGVLDIAPASVTKLKQKMRRKSRALRRWQLRKGLDGTKAAIAFIRVFNRKLFENPNDRELTWARWFFPVINTTASLEVLDHYAQDCVRWLISGKRNKTRFRVRYDEIKALGYRSLVHEYYSLREEDGQKNALPSAENASPVENAERAAPVQDA